MHRGSTFYSFGRNDNKDSDQPQDPTALSNIKQVQGRIQTDATDANASVK